MVLKIRMRRIELKWDNMTIKDDVEIGEGTKIYDENLINLYGCKIGRNCVIANFVEIGKGVIIGDNCKIEAFSFIPTGVIIEDNVFIGPHACFTNDKRPKIGNEWNVLKTIVKEGASIGANSTIICGITIGEGAMVGAGSVVTKDVAPGKTVAGNPARPINGSG
jgi:acetyltransferase-like isoleucine patch superfamily enzyme